MRMILCDVCGSSINLADGKGYLGLQLAELVHEVNQQVFDICICCTSSLHIAIKELIDHWKQTKGFTLKKEKIHETGNARCIQRDDK